MKVIVILLALVVLPLIMAIFQRSSYNDSGKPAVEKAALDAMVAAGVDNPEVEVDHLDVSLSGITATKADRDAVRQLVSDVERGAPRAFVTDDLKTYGSLAITKKQDVVAVNGDLHEGTWDNIFAKENAENGSVFFAKGGEYSEKGYFINPTMVNGSEASQGWIRSFFALPGDRGLSINAKTNELNAYGDMTERLQKRFIASAAAAGIALKPSFNLIPAKDAVLNTNIAGAGVVASGTIPDDLDLAPYQFAERDGVKTDPFTDAPPAFYGPDFVQWHNAYYSDRAARRGYSLNGQALNLSGFATSFLSSDWVSSLQEFGFTPSVSGLKIFPSTYHYPSYQRESQIAEADLEPLSKALDLNRVLFASSSSEVQGPEIFKVDALAEAIKKHGADAQFVIGGHADSTGNVKFNQELSRKRALQVLSDLEARGISKEIFTVASFGSSKAQSTGSSADDRKVEILIK